MKLAALLAGVVVVGCGGSERAAVAPTPSSDGPLTLAVQPAPAYLEVTDREQLLNCDLVVANGTGVTWTLQAIEVAAYDRTDALAWRKFLDGNGVSPSIATVPNREIAAQTTALVFNPLPAFPRDLDLARVRFELTFAAGDDERVVTAEVSPVVYPGSARLRLPLAGRFQVWDGHDLVGHHRRWDYLFPPFVAIGFDTNGGRYADDYVPVDAQGEAWTGDPDQNESWLGFGQPVLAAGAGTVVKVIDVHPDDRSFDESTLAADLLAYLGNHIIIDHGGGEHSLVAHLQQGSARVAVGDQVTAGQELARIGASGAVAMPHLHYQLQTDATGHAEGLPSQFHDFVRVRGATRVPVARGAVESGELIETTPP